MTMRITLTQIQISVVANFFKKRQGDLKTCLQDKIFSLN